jgi:tRNA-modifying protein YgfZ
MQNDFTPNPTHLLPQSGVTPLDHLGLIHIEGADAAKFIHGQLTQDFALLDMTQARLAALCSSKGRMLASFVGYKDTAGNIFLVCSKDLISATIQRLSMFVLRAKAKLRDASNEYRIHGVIGGTTAAPWSKIEAANGSVHIQLYPALGTERQLVVTPINQSVPEGPTVSPEYWLWLEVRSGVATVSAALVEQLVPQMLNFESVGGVSFKKGCYPGQEVVARSQFRGTIKRRAYVVHCDTVLQAGDVVYTATDPEQEVGVVVQSAPTPETGFDAIISCQTAAAIDNNLRMGGENKRKLHLLPIGYTLLEDI